jgi:hypothetical protein
MSWADFDANWEPIQWRDWDGNIHDGAPSDDEILDAQGIRYHSWDDRWESQGGTGWEDYKWVFTPEPADWDEWDWLIGNSVEQYIAEP